MSHYKFFREFRRYYRAEFGERARLLTAAEIDGEEMLLNEYEVRYLQIKAKEADDFEEFCRRVKVYDRKEKAGRKFMIFRRDGCFVNDFHGSFYKVLTNLTIELL